MNSSDPDSAPPELGTIVCGVDGSPQSLEAVRQGLVLGGRNAVSWALAAWDPSQARHAGIHASAVMQDLRNQRAEALRRVAEEFPDLRPMLVSGREVAALLSGVANLGADLISVGSHGQSRPAGVLFGSVASAMVHHAPCSVLVARTSRSEFPSLLVHADDGSPESLDAARLAGRLAAEHDSSVVTVHVSETADGDIPEEAVGLLEAAGREPVVRVEQGSPHRVIIETANELNASMIVMGSRGRTGLAALGSVSERVAHRADCSVLIVRQASYPAPEE